MTYVYKRLAEGGYTAIPVQSDKDRDAKVAQGWTLEPPVDAPAPVAIPPEEAESVAEDYRPVEAAPAPRKRGRPRAESVN